MVMIPGQKMQRLVGLLAMGVLQWQAFALAGIPETDMQSAVAAYRHGKYAEAQSALNRLHQQEPADLKVTYYLAMTEAQLGRFQQARQLYQEIIERDPQSDAARLSVEGIKYLPAEEALDPPPRFSADIPQPLNSAVPASPVQSPMGNMSPQDLMAMQMMMQMGGGQNGGGLNPMMFSMMSGANGAEGMKIDPDVMSSMMMNQMMENFTLDSNDKD